jgi:putative ABC transport system permease protein
MNWRRLTTFTTFNKRAQADRELQQELESFIEITADQYVAQGMDPDEARRSARLKLGNPTRIREEVYEMNTAALVDSTVRDLRHSLRMLRMNPAFAVTAILTLALGIGATTSIFSVVDGVMIKPLPYPDPEAVVRVGHSALFGTVRTNNFPFAPQWLGTYAEHNQTFHELGMWRPGVAAVTGLGNPEQANTLLVTQGFLPALGVQPAFGRWFSRTDDQPGTPETVILSSGYWQRRFGGDPAVVGRVITVDSRPREVIGVMPARFSFPGFLSRGPSADLILPLQLNLAEPVLADWGYAALARLEPGVTVARANADVARMLPIFTQKYGGTGVNSLNSLHLLPAVRPLKDDVVGDVGGVLWVLLGGIGIVLLIACANVANLLLVRSEGRGQEFAVRAALGAGWGRIARALVVESLTLSLAGALIGIGLAYGGLQILLAYGPANLPRLNEIAIDAPVLAFATATSIVSGLLFALVPIVKLIGSRFASNLPEFLRGGGRWASAGRSQHRSQNTLVVVQVALALVLLVSSGLMIRTFQNMRSVQPGFTDPATIQTFRITIGATQVPEPERVTRLQTDILRRLETIPGVTSAAFVNSVPMDISMQAIAPAEGHDYGNQLPIPRTIKFISPGLFRTLGTSLVAGRDLSWVEMYEQRNVTLVSESLAREEWGSAANALGKRMHIGIRGPWQQVVGVVGDIYDDGADKKPSAIVYWPARMQEFMTGPPTVPRSVAFAIRSSRTSTGSFIRDIRQAVLAVNPDLPMAQVRPLREVYDQSMARTSMTLVMLGIAGAMALLLGIVGIYGVLAYAVAQRQREVGIRLALGAQPRAVKRMFVYRGMMISGVGIAIGAAAAAVLTRSMSSLLFGVTPVDAPTFAAAAGVLVVAALTASYIPARRAAAVDPVETLRGQ